MKLENGGSQSNSWSSFFHTRPKQTTEKKTIDDYENEQRKLKNE